MRCLQTITLTIGGMWLLLAAGVLVLARAGPPAHSYLLYWSEHYGLWTLYRAWENGSNSVPLTDNRLYPIADSPLLTHEHWVYFRAGRNPNGDELLYRVHGASGELQALAGPPGPVRYIGWSANEAWLLLQSYGESRDDIYRIRPDGTGLQNLTASLGDDSDVFLDWSPGRDWILFSRSDSRTRDEDIYRVRVDGSALQNLTNRPGYEEYNGFSPDGGWMLYTAPNRQTTDIFRLHPATGALENITQTVGFDKFLGWSVDGRWLYFLWNFGGEERFYRIHADGTQQELIAQGLGFVNYPLFAPDGKWVIFTTQRSRQPIFHRMRTDGYELQPFINGQLDIDRRYMQWSPDGAWLYFIGNSSTMDIYRIRPDGSQLQNLTASGNTKEHLNWSPDGDWLLFNGYLLDDVVLYRMRPDGTKVQPLTNTPGLELVAGWLPYQGLVWQWRLAVGLGGALLGLAVLARRRW